MKTRVVHVDDNVPGSVYIGRANPRRRLKSSGFGNPFKIGGKGGWSRAEAVAMYSGYIKGMLKNPDFGEHNAKELSRLRDRPLACWCRHDGEQQTEANACHGDVLVDLLERHTDDELIAMCHEQ